MKTFHRAITILFLAACTLFGLYYLVADFGKAIAGQYALVLLAASVMLSASLIRNRGWTSGLAKTILVMIILSQFPIMACWVVFFPLERALIALFIHSVFCLTGIGCLILERIPKVNPMTQQ